MGVHDGHRARMKARFVRNGLDNFDDHSVLELLLFYAVPRRDVNELAHALLDHFGTLDAVFEASCEDMMRVPGVGENVATLLTLIPQVGRRYQMAKRRQQTILRSSEDAGNYLVPLYLYERTEVVYLLCLDASAASSAVRRLAAAWSMPQKCPCAPSSRRPCRRRRCPSSSATTMWTLMRCRRARMSSRRAASGTHFCS